MNVLDKNIDILYTKEYEETKEEYLENIFRDNTFKKYRTKTIKSGEMLESESYPIWNTRSLKIGQAVRDVKIRNIEQIQNINHKNKRKNITRLINANFTSEDIWITVGYRNNELPSTLEQAKKDVVNYIRRLQRYCNKNKLPKLKYLYVTEYSENKRVHHHIVMNFPDRDIAEKKWTKGAWPQARRLMPNDYGLEGLARYISKDLKGANTYGYSLNLKKTWLKPYVKTNDSRLTKRKAEKIARGKVDAKTYYEKMYKGYEFIDLEVKYSDFVSGCYLYVRMRKIEENKSKNRNRRE